MSLLAGEFCPISGALFGRLYRASPEGLAALIKTIPSETRAMLAVYCYRRPHLLALGLGIAETCLEHELHRFGGKIGAEMVSLAHVSKAVKEQQQLELKTNESGWKDSFGTDEPLPAPSLGDVPVPFV